MKLWLLNTIRAIIFYPYSCAWSANTQFRWFQPGLYLTSWDFWGLENVNIVPGPGGASFTWSPGGQVTQNITVALQR